MNLSPLPKLSFLANNGRPAVGYLLFTYAAGTGNKLATYQNQGGTPNTNPIVLDFRGEANVWLDPELTYKFVLAPKGDTDPPTNPIWTVDDIAGPLTILDVTQQFIGELLWPRTTAEIAAGVTPVNFAYEPYHAWRYLSASQLADVQSYALSVNVTAPLQNAMNAAWEAQQPCIVPGGGYLITTLTVPGTSARRERAFIMIGDGVGEIFDRTLTGGTIFRSTTNAVMLQYIQDVAITGNGQADISGIRFEGDASTYLINLEALYGQSEFHHCAIFQDGTGGGINIGLSNTIDVHHNYVINGDWNTTVLGVARTGIGFNIVQDINTGLTMLRKNTSRGFLTAYNIGNGVTSAYVTKIEHCECSVVYNGIILAAGTSKAVIDTCYIEGGDGGTGILDGGNYTTVSNCLIFAGFGTAIDGSNTGLYGSVYENNVLAAASVANSKLLRIGSSGAFGGPGKIVRGNSFTFSGSGGSIAGVVAITFTGIDPRIDWGGNVFDPRGPWVGGAGTMKIDDQSTHSDGAGSGLYGFGMADQGNYEFPTMYNGALGLGRGVTLTASAIAGNVLTLPRGSSFVLTAASAQTVNSFSAPDLQGKFFTLHLTNANTTLANTANVKLSGSVNFTPAAAGSYHIFEIHGSVAREAARIAY